MLALESELGLLFDFEVLFMTKNSNGNFEKHELVAFDIVHKATFVTH